VAKTAFLAVGRAIHSQRYREAGRRRLLSDPPGQYRDVNVLAEMFVWGNSPADLLGEG
jgi:hypothetical protein